MNMKQFLFQKSYSEKLSEGDCMMYLLKRVTFDMQLKAKTCKNNSLKKHAWLFSNKLKMEVLKVSKKLFF